jgi:SAM-dependent methyltransferase
MENNRSAWRDKPLLRQIYADFYERILMLLDRSLPGRILEIGSGMGNLKSHDPSALCSDLFPNPWLDVVCDGYELPFADATLSHLILFDVFHHLRAPKAFLNEARRVLVAKGRLILFEPYISWTSFLAYGLFHHEPIGWRERIETVEVSARPRSYYAAQGNATRIFFRHEQAECLEGWSVFHAQAVAGFSYLLSGGFSGPSLYPINLLPWMRRLDQSLSHYPTVFGARCLVGLRRV